MGLMLGAAQPVHAQDAAVVVQSCGAVPQPYSLGGPRPITVDVNGNLCTGGPAAPASGAAGYPPGATPITAYATGTTGSVQAILAASLTKFTYICGFNVSAIGGTAAVGPVTVINAGGSTQTYQLTSSATGVLLQQNFTPCIPGGVINQSLVVQTTADGTATAVDVNVWGYQQ
jgi:hypothetical protein